MTRTRSYPAEVVGESFANADGTSRQAIIARIGVGDPIALRPEPDNPHDARAVAVHHRLGQIGYISRERRWVWERLERGHALTAKVHAINAAGEHAGVVLWITAPTGAGASARPKAKARPAPRKSASSGVWVKLLKALFR